MKQSPVRCDEGLEVRAADLFLALEQAFHVDRQPGVRSQQALDGFDVSEHLAFVVARTASVQAALTHRRLERR